ncbi:hypothetical protein JQC92_08540 [Shewanella sp. 202IG2-18]|uniref:hypothetical protein n=1 Tax=Parashewanella hymeniacidonis TaxID=2807618 RepID=UPI0019600DC3|nr:hypothetical protein [Parashewanella hymeniacidonis]MBM7072074.1 hypothetical protein [Parashewanella hymeniacidonis]
MTTSSVFVKPISPACGLNHEYSPLTLGKFRYQIDTICHDFYIDASKELSNEEIDELKKLCSERFDEPLLHPELTKKPNNPRLETLLNEIGSPYVTQCSTRYNCDGFNTWFPSLDVPFYDTRNTVEKYKGMLGAIVDHKIQAKEHSSQFASLATKSKTGSGFKFTNRSLLLIERLSALELFINQVGQETKLDQKTLSLLDKFLKYSISQLINEHCDVVSYQEIAAALNVEQINDVSEIGFEGSNKLSVQIVRLCFNIETSLLRNHSPVFDSYSKEFSELIKSFPYQPVEIYSAKGHLTKSLVRAESNLTEAEEYSALPKSEHRSKGSDAQADKTIEKHGTEAIYVSAYMDSRDTRFIGSQFEEVFLIVIGRVNHGEFQKLKQDCGSEDRLCQLYKLEVDGFTPRFVDDQVSLYCLNVQPSELKKVLSQIPKKYNCQQIGIKPTSKAAHNQTDDFLFTPNGIV